MGPTEITRHCQGAESGCRVLICSESFQRLRSGADTLSTACFYFKFTLSSRVQCHSAPVQHRFLPFRGQVSRAGWTQGIRRCTAFLCHIMCVHTSSSYCHSLKFVYMCINPRGLTLERSCSKSSPSQMPEGPRKAHVGPLLQGDSNSPYAA